MADLAHKVDVGAFVARWRPRSLCLNFRQVWRDTVTGEDVDFAAIADPAELKLASDRAEDQYLGLIDEGRRAWVEKHPAARQAAAMKQFERELCATDLYYLAKFVLGYRDMRFHLHYFMAGTMTDVVPGYRGLREFPRDTFKTTVMGISYLVQQVLREPNVKILYKSNAEGNAANKITEAKRHFMTNELLQALFPEHTPRNKQEEGSGIKWTTPARTAVQAEATFTAAGVGSGKTSQHYDMIIGDDFWDDKSVTSAEVMEKTRKDLHQLEYLLATPARGVIVFIGTRFAYDDITMDLMKNPHYECVIVSGVTPQGRSLFPENLLLTHMAFQEQAQLYVFSCQIMLNPTTEDQRFKDEWFRFVRWAEVKAEIEAGRMAAELVMLADSAVEGKSTSDNVAIAIVAKLSDGRKLVVAAIRQKMEPSRFVQQVCDWWDVWRPVFVVRQKTALETTLQSFFREENRRREERGREPVRFYDYSLAKREKKARITASLQPRLQNGELYFDPDIGCWPEIRQEFLQHPHSANDDIMDALAMIDDPVVARLPDWQEPTPRPPDTYVLAPEDVMDDERIMRRQSAKAAYDFVRGERRHRVRRGLVVK